MISTRTSYNAQTKAMDPMEAKNDMKKHARAPRGAGKAGIPAIHIGGMETLGALPIDGIHKNAKRRTTAHAGRRGGALITPKPLHR